MLGYHFLIVLYLMKKTDEYMLNRIKWKAGRHGIYKRSNGYTFFFDELPESIKGHLKTDLKEYLSGIPVIFFSKPSNQWTLLCTKCVVGYSGERVFCIDFEDIFEIETYPFWITKKSKLDWDELTISDKKSNRYVFHTYDGYDHNLLHNILLMCCQLVA
ncbi:hypothetical protein SAMN05192574_11685 [Mucilaginibacter gossypiicola]|uniref:PH domain-containing protein n=2 Tax=Mucilaginibacter gossypiicola TaxID=551995 RepID=A0A1H8TPH1_9SPHI|nr:hypothetical protein SAMN05192574_11685 [Mucilaginibacter gossypiicola]